MLEKSVFGIFHQIMDVKEVAELMGVHKRTIYRMANEGQMPAFKFGGRWRFEEKTLINWINQEMIKNYGNLQ